MTASERGSFLSTLSTVRAAEDGSADMPSGRSQPLTHVNDPVPLGSASQAPATAAHRHGDYNRARIAEDEHVRRQREQAARTVSREARDEGDCSLLLSILGLDTSDQTDEGDTHLR